MSNMGKPKKKVCILEFTKKNATYSSFHDLSFKNFILQLVF